MEQWELFLSPACMHMQVRTVQYCTSDRRVATAGLGAAAAGTKENHAIIRKVSTVSLTHWVLQLLESLPAIFCQVYLLSQQHNGSPNLSIMALGQQSFSVACRTQRGCTVLQHARIVLDA